MRIYRILGCCVALTLPPMTMAELPFSNESLGQLEATLSFCSQLNPQATAQYEAKLALLVKDLPKKEVMQARDTKDYREGYDSITAQLTKMPKDSALKVCTSGLVDHR